MESHKKEWYTRYKEEQTQHTCRIPFKNDRNTNKMEQLNGGIRDREKIMKPPKTDDSPIITGLQIYHNYIRSHMGIDRHTPSEKAGIKVEELNKWIIIIQNAQVLTLYKRKS